MPLINSEGNENNEIYHFMALIIVIGPPASGKSHFCRELCIHYPFFKHIELDSMIDINDNKVYKQKRQAAYQVIMGEISEHPFQDFIVDDTFHLFSMRKPFLRLAAGLRVGFGIIKMSDSLSILLERNRKRESQVSTDTLVSIYNKFEELRPEETIHLISSPGFPLAIPIEIYQGPKSEIQNDSHILNIEKNRLVHEAIGNLKFKNKSMIQKIIQLKNECDCLPELRRKLQIYLDTINVDPDDDLGG